MDNSRTTSHFWTDEETRLMITQLKELNILKFMDGRKRRNGELFKKIAQRMLQDGFPRTPEQVRVRWKNVKQAYFAFKRNNGINGQGRTSCPFFDLLEELFGSRPLSLAKHHGVDSGVARQTAETTMDPEEIIETTLLGSSPVSSSGASSPTRSAPACSPPPPLTPPPSSNPLRSTKVTADITGTRTQQTKKIRDVDVIVKEIREMNKKWEERMERSEAREEQLIATILQTNERMVAQLMEGMHTFQSRWSSPPFTSYSPQHFQEPQTCMKEEGD
ncbi:hypothetical protein ACEWY4_010681 [Coilia grayii]|uniref:Myb-like domain-containing protein n=1 Tax=Coilia grayii TaxID=363190 RepID=A0ABD1K2K1_9TELE